MPTEKPRVTFTISQEKLDKVDAYRFDNKFKNQTQAILSLIEKGLADLEQKEAPLFSSEAMKLAQDYDSLDEWGKRQLRTVADNEIARHIAQKEKSTELDIDAEVASYRSELELQREVTEKSSASDGSGVTKKMA